MLSNQFMNLAVIEAKKAFLKNEVPVGAIIVDSKTGEIVTAAHNLSISNCDPLAHAEIIAIREACKTRLDKYLYDCDIYVTLEPCPMCAYAISLAKIRRVYFGALDIKSGGVESGPTIFDSPSAHHKPEIYGGMMEKEVKNLMQRFFKQLR